MVTRKGRKRKAGQRDNHGDLRTKRPDDKILASLQPHRRNLPENLRLSEKATTVLGKLSLFSRITDEHYQAGLLYQRVVNAYRAVIGSIDPLLAPVPGFNRTIGDEEARRRKAAYASAFEFLMEAGQRSAVAVARAAVYDNPDYGTLDDLKRGLGKLVQHFGLTVRKTGIYGK